MCVFNGTQLENFTQTLFVMSVTFIKSVLPLEVVGLLGEVCVQVDEVLEVGPDLPHVGGHQPHVQLGPLGRPGGEAEGGVGPVVHGEDGGLGQAGVGGAGGGALRAEAFHAAEGVGGLARGGGGQGQGRWARIKDSLIPPFCVQNSLCQLSSMF